MDNLKKHDYIELVSKLEEHKKIYKVTECGLEILEMENRRLKQLVSIYENRDDLND